jgi:DNA helicase-2/ATP-dependent DNA helicase PcrA
MDSEVMTPIELLKECIRNNNNFVLQGGAGSGKTETLKQTLSFISEEYPTKKVACITHTNLAVDAIQSRVEGEYSICTIHSFLNNVVKAFKKNMHQELYQLFILKPFVRGSIENFLGENEFKKSEHDKYKDIYKKLGKKLFSLKKESLPKVTGKKIYDNDSTAHNETLNAKITLLNEYIKLEISKKSWHKVKYNDTAYDNFSNLTFGHDGLITISTILFSNYPLLSKILIDKFDYVFIDEFQDTHPNIMKIFLELLPKEKIIIGLFGDSMQGIYDDGIGTVEPYIKDSTLIMIPKKDNYRCSQPVIDFLNHIRVPIDGLKQKIAYKKNNGQLESIEQRNGNVAVYYSIYPNPRPHQRSNAEVKADYLQSIMKTLKQIEEKNSGYKKLMLTNKAIAANLDFLDLFNLFNDRYSEVNNEIEDLLEKLGLLDLAEICIAFKEKNYKTLISKLKKSGFVINKISDKSKVTKLLTALIKTKLGVIKVLEFALKNKLVNSQDNYDWYLTSKNEFLNGLIADNEYQNFKKAYLSDGNSFAKFDKNHSDFFTPDMEYTGREASYDYLCRKLKKERFYIDLFSNKVKFDEVITFYDYINENAEFITMHKTKGTGINNVLVVLDDFFWSKYQFNSLFDIGSSTSEMKSKVQKLYYVACSRAKSNLICLKLITQDEEDMFKKYFPSNVQLNKI